MGGSPRLGVGGLGDDLIVRFWKWRNQAIANLKKEKNIDSPYISNFDFSSMPTSGIPSGTSFGDDPVMVEKLRHDSQTTMRWVQMAIKLVPGGSSKIMFKIFLLQISP